MNRSELTFSAILVPLDYLVVFLAALAAYGLRFGTFLTEIRPVFYEFPFKDFVSIAFIASFLWIIVFSVSGLYGIKANRRILEEWAKIFFACSTAVLIIIVFIFFKREFFSSRFIILSGWFLTIIFICLERLIVRTIQHYLLKKGVGSHRVIVLGQDETTNRLINEINKHPSWGYKIVKYLKIENEEQINQLAEFLKNNDIDEIIQADPSVTKELVFKIIDLCTVNHLTFKYTTNLFEASATNIKTYLLAGIPIVEIKRTPLDGWGKILKRFFDIILGFLFLILFSPIFLVVAIIVKLDSAGPVFVGLERVGQKGKKFILYKFRSMIKNAHTMKKELAQYNERTDGPLFKMKNDPRITRVGKFIRKTSIDELPQFFNVISGQMSIVGPRPHEPEEVSQYHKHHQKLLAIKPGITGMAQVSGRSDLGFEEEVKLDVYYIENWSLLLDLQLIFKTPFILLTRRAAP